jgi:uncharacterized damage-inducible protein DinB
MTTQQEELFTRIRGYLQHQANKDLDAIRSLIQQGHEQLLSQLEGVTEEQARWKPAPDVWSVLEVLRHVVPSKRGVARICAALARGETPRGFGEEGQATAEQPAATDDLASLAEAHDALEEAHRALLTVVDTFAQGTDLEARFDHGFFGSLNCREWAVFQRVHDADHAQQIEQIKATPGFPA